jgi:hypothetical protein
MDAAVRITGLVQRLLGDDHGINHAILQIGPDTREGCDELAW